ncbi:Flavohemoprotein [Phycisphaerales bacterium]|nr:Flavohemoprotein [Phycisphaerales bacterium]
MDRIQAHLVRSSLEDFCLCGPALVSSVIRNLGDHYPDLRGLFPDDTSRYHVRWFATLQQVARFCDTFHRLEKPLGELGKQAAACGATAAHYRIVRNELLQAMADLAGDAWTADTANSWSLVLDAMTGAMLAGAMDIRRAA